MVVVYIKLVSLTVILGLPELNLHPCIKKIVKNQQLKIFVVRSFLCLIMTTKI